MAAGHLAVCDGVCVTHEYTHRSHASQHKDSRVRLTETPKGSRVRLSPAV